MREPRGGHCGDRDAALLLIESMLATPLPGILPAPEAADACGIR
jgi:hypothetical protein